MWSGMQGRELSVEPDFPAEDFAWLLAEAKRRNLEIYEVVNELIRLYLPNDFYLDRPMTEAEAAQAFAEQLRQLVRRVRLGTV